MGFLFLEKNSGLWVLLYMDNFLEMSDTLMEVLNYNPIRKRRWKPASWVPCYFSCPDRPGVTCVTVVMRNGSDLTMDAQDWELLGRLRFCGFSRGYAVCSAFRKCRHTSGVAHRMVAALMYGDGALTNTDGRRVDVDHINGNPSDNRRCNLRLCDHSQNMRNQSTALGSSRFKGVYRSQTGGKWKANVTYTRPGFPRSIHLGTFTNEEDAARAYDSKVRELFGEFAKTNEDLGLLAHKHDKARR